MRFTFELADANGRPQHMSAWCKEQLGWLKPAVIDPTVQQKLVLSPVEGSSRECFKVLIRPDGSEHLLLEDRRKTGFDTDLAGEGLLVWHVIAGHPVPGRKPRDNRPRRAARVPHGGAVPQHGQSRAHAVHDPVEPIAAWRGIAGVYHGNRTPGRWADHFRGRVSVFL